VRSFRIIPALAALLTASPASAAPRPRSVDLRHLTWSDQTATAVIPERGSLRLTLDPRLQHRAEQLLAAAAPHEGAIVVADVRTGRILVWASRGSADFVATPFAPSASVFKVVTATTLLEKGKVTFETRRCWEGGEHSIEARDLVDHPGPETQCAPFGHALGRSINLVFARLASRELSAADLRAQAALLGFAGEVPIDVPVRAAELHIQDDPLGVARGAAGFWNGRVSPLGPLFAMHTIANGGERVRLTVLDESARVSDGRAMTEATARTLRRMLEVTTRSGTSAAVFRDGAGARVFRSTSVAGKTGTLVGGTPMRMYSWFAGFAPASRPEIAVSVMLANDLKWREKANEVARDFLEGYFGPTAVASRSGTGQRRR